MKLKQITDQLQFEADVLQGEETRDVTYSSQNTFPDAVTAQKAFAQSKEKLLNVNGWSGLSAFTADFVLHDQTGQPASDSPPQVGDYIQIVLPGPMPENWVKVVHIELNEKRAEFTVKPSQDPRKRDSDEVEHFFREEARSTFRVELSDNTITASEIGRNEGINNQGSQAGDRTVINTVIAEGGWLFYQKLQWKLLTDYLVHL